MKGSFDCLESELRIVVTARANLMCFPNRLLFYENLPQSMCHGV